MSELYTLAVLESLIQSKGSIRLDELWAIIFSRYQNNPDFYSIVGCKLEDFLRFIENQPAIFKPYGGFVYTPEVFNDIYCKSNNSPDLFTHPEPKAGYQSVVHLERDREIESVKYFQEQLLRKTERWVPIKSLAGHLSQASPAIRLFVGPQSEFIHFLRRHPLFFEIQGELVSLTERVRQYSSILKFPSGRRKSRPPSYVQDELRRHSCFERLSTQTNPAQTLSLIPIQSKKMDDENIVVDQNECCAVFWLKCTVEQHPNHSIDLNCLFKELLKAPKCVPSSIGWTQIELMEFLRKYHKIFNIEQNDQIIMTRNTENLHLFVNEESDRSDPNVLLMQRGTIFCVNKLWGIIDLGSHEHVFFDRSLFKHVSNLSKHFQLSEVVFFNAVLAPKESRAKWRATCVWKETDQLAPYVQHMSLTNAEPTHSTKKVETADDPDSGVDNLSELNEAKSSPTALRNMFTGLEDAFDHCVKQFASIQLNDTTQRLHVPTNVTQPIGQRTVTDEARFHNQSLEADLCDIHSLSSSPVSELNTLSGVPSISGLGDLSNAMQYDQSLSSGVRKEHFISCMSNVSDSDESGQGERTVKTVAIQTLFTGDIMATKLYHENAEHIFL